MATSTTTDAAPRPKFSGPTNAAGFAQGIAYAAAVVRSAPTIEAAREILEAVAQEGRDLIARIDEAERAVAARVRAGAGL